MEESLLANKELKMKNLRRCFLLLGGLLLSTSFAFAQSPTISRSKPASTGEVSRTQPQAASVFDYLPLQAGASYTYAGVYQREDLATPAREVYTIVTKSVSRDGTDVFYFVDEQKSNATVQSLDVNMVGLGAYSKGPEGLYTYDCAWNQDLVKIPPKKPKLFIRAPLRIGDTVRIMSDDRSSAYEYRVLGFEALTVPAGRFERALKLEMKMLYADGNSEQSFAWFGNGVGLVKRIRATGRVEELLSYEKPDASRTFVTRSIDEWVGLKFVFLPQRKMFQKYGYQSFHRPEEVGKSLPYDAYKNRIALVSKVTPFAYGHYVELVLEATQEKVIAEAFGDTVTAFGPLDDLERARKRYKGKTLWTRDNLRTYNDELDEEGVSTPLRYITVKVIDVVPGWDSHQPIRFLLQTEAGFEVFLDVHMTDTNVSDKLRKYNSFSSVFLTSPPQP